MAGQAREAAEELNRATALFSAGRLDEAMSAVDRLLRADPRALRTLNLAAAIHLRSGRMEAAADALRRVLAIEPTFAPAHNNLGMALRTLGRLEEASDSLRRAVALKPDYAEAQNNLGLVLNNLGRHDEAESPLRQALAVKRAFPEAWNNLGNVLRAMARPAEAAEAYREALALNPKHAGHQNNLGLALAAQGRTQDAESSFRRAIDLDPSYADAHFNLGLTLDALGRTPEAVGHFIEAALPEPRNRVFLARLAQVLPHVTFSHYDSRIERALDDILSERTMARPFELFRPVITLLGHTAPFRTALDHAARGDVGANAAGVCAALAASPLFLKIAALAPAPDPLVESLLTQLRRALLFSTPGGAESLAVQAALALNCFANEYVFHETEDEKRAVAALADSLAETVKAGATPDAVNLARLAAYRPLGDFPFLENMPPPGLEVVFRRQIDEMRDERERREAIPQLKPIDDAMSKKVQAQYEENPYPRWTNTALAQTPRRLREIAEARGLDVGAMALSDAPRVLVAGCGTGQHALIAAADYRDASVVAVDLSRSSLARAQRKAAEFGATNIRFMQGDILDLALLEEEFDVVECVGTLFHMADPVAGWRSVASRLKPHGLMKVGLYSDAARRGVWAARDLILERGLEDGTLENIRAFRHAMLSGEIDEFEGRASIVASPEFYSTSECRDLIFHVNEKTFTIPRIRDALAALDLRFLGFELPGDTGPRFDGEMGAGRRSDLDAWDEFESAHPETFVGMYMFWVARRTANR